MVQLLIIIRILNNIVTRHRHDLNGMKKEATALVPDELEAVKGDAAITIFHWKKEKPFPSGSKNVIG